MAAEGNDVADDFHDRADLETAGNSGDKDFAVRIWEDLTRGIDDKVLADDCKMSRSNYSKVASGQQGDLLGLVCRVGKHRPELRREFFARLAEHEGIDLLSAAAEQLTIAAVRYLRLRGVRFDTAKARMAKATVR